MAFNASSFKSSMGSEKWCISHRLPSLPLRQTLHDPRDDPWHQAVRTIEDLGRGVTEDQKPVPHPDGSNYAADNFLLLCEGEYVVECGPLGTEVLHHWGVDGRRADHREGDAQAFEVAPKGLAQSEYSKLAGTIGAELGQALEAGDARHVENAATSGHCRARAEQHVHGTEVVDLHVSPACCGGKRVEVAYIEYARGVEDKRGSAPILHQALKGRFDLGRLGQVNAGSRAARLGAQSLGR